MRTATADTVVEREAPAIAPETHASPETTPTLLDPVLQAAFDRDGFVVIDAITPSELAVFRSAWAELHHGTGQGFESDIIRRTPADTERLEAETGPIWDALLDRTLTDHQRFLLGFLTKWPDEQSELAMHQDWTYVDERRFRSLSFWIALDDCSDELDNGPVAVIPGSHRFVEGYRGPAVEDWHRDLGEYLEGALQAVPLRAGQAILIDNALLHGSAPNRSGAPRRGLAAAVAPRAAQFRFAAPARGDQVMLYDLGDRYLPGYDPDDPEVADLPVLATTPRVLTVDRLALASALGPIDLPEELAGAPSRSERGDARLTEIARTELDAFARQGANAVPAPFLPGWAAGAIPSDRLLPLMRRGRETMAGSGPFRRTTAAIKAASSMPTAWLVELRPGRAWTQLAPEGRGPLHALLLTEEPVAGAITADRRPLGPAGAGGERSLRLENGGTSTAWILLAAASAQTTPRRRRWSRDDRRTDEAIAAVLPPAAHPEGCLP